jgi:hypothetical protein
VLQTLLFPRMGTYFESPKARSPESFRNVSQVCSSVKGSSPPPALTLHFNQAPPTTACPNPGSLPPKAFCWPLAVLSLPIEYVSTLMTWGFCIPCGIEPLFVEAHEKLSRLIGNCLEAWYFEFGYVREICSCRLAMSVIKSARWSSVWSFTIYAKGWN